MGRKLSLILVLLIATIVAVTPALAEEAKADNGMIILRSDQLTQSITSFDKGEWGPINTIIKLYEGGYHRWGYRIYLNSYVELADIDNTARSASTPKRRFLAPLAVLDDSNPLNDQQMGILSPDKPAIYDRNTTDCGADKFMLIKKGSIIYLMLAEKPAFDDSGEIISQASVAFWEVKLFRLTSENYFIKTAEQKTDAKVCTPHDVYRQMHAFAQSTLK